MESMSETFWMTKWEFGQGLRLVGAGWAWKRGPHGDNSASRLRLVLGSSANVYAVDC